MELNLQVFLFSLAFDMAFSGCHPTVCGDGEIAVQNQEKEIVTNGCGPQKFPDWINSFISQFTGPETEKCCDQHDICYSTCTSTHDECEREFGECLKGVDNSFKFFTKSFGCSVFTDQKKEFCECVSEDGDYEDGDYERAFKLEKL
ncbi:group XIIA secretory phospholipase A2-like isoform X2 [Convolutriloba macropyga]|uniref:group XIIA secretory phospholipase A2-like isoform X2 n=1 Tax=Convolutriloba macropyga TaxID=536237 RepID=UPI003F525EDD